MTAEELQTVKDLTAAVRELDSTVTALVSLKIYEEAERDPFKIPSVLTKITDAKDIINDFLNCFNSIQEEK